MTLKVIAPRVAAVLLYSIALGIIQGRSAPHDVSFHQSAETVDAYDFVEIILSVDTPDARNPFTDVEVKGHFEQVGGGQAVTVEGFCDADDGSVFRIRFMPAHVGEHTYSVTYRQADFKKNHNGTFRAVDGHRRGVVRVDPEYPWHFIWDGTREHYFWNGTTTYFLMGFEHEKVIRDSIDRLHMLKVNRLRVLLAGRQSHSWGEPVVPVRGFTLCLNPWVAERPYDVSNPGYHYTRYNLPHWQRFERLLRYAREKDIVVSVIFDVADSKVRPAEGSEDERRYFRHGVARLAAFSNVMWDLGNEHDHYRSYPEWADALGPLVKQWDPYNHLTSAHNKVYRTSEWADMALVQWWRRPVNEFMLSQRREQAKAGRIIPQVLEEYGYEDHYPVWSPNYPDGQSADANRRAAWEITMAGCYQTTGETAKRGTGVYPDTGGGWINGRGDDSMVMLRGYAHMVDFFTSFEWWKTEPRNDLVDSIAMCLAEPGRLYAVYVPTGRRVKVSLEPGKYEVTWFNPRNGQSIPGPLAVGPEWVSPMPPGHGDWAILLER